MSPKSVTELFLTSQVLALQVRQWTEKDPVPSKVKTFLLHGWPSVTDNEELRHYFKLKTELSLQDGCILWGDVARGNLGVMWHIIHGRFIGG